MVETYHSDWGPYVEFNCCDINQYVTVEMRVVDVNGNENICWLDVLIEDKTLPYCYGLRDVTATCDELPSEFDPYDTDQLSEIFGRPDVFDNCAAYALELEPEVSVLCDTTIVERRFLAVDDFGNTSAAPFIQIIRIEGDCTIDQVECVDGMFVELLAVDPPADVDGDNALDKAAVTVRVDALITGIIEDCSSPVRYSINRVGELPDIDQTTLVITCKDSASVDVEVYAWDSANNPISIQPDGTIGGPNYSYCTTTIEIKDPNNLCGFNLTGPGEIYGNILTAANKEQFQGVGITLTGVTFQEAMTQTFGEYEFIGLPVIENYTVTPIYDYDHKKGISTLDVIKIDELINSYPVTSSPYARIAADVDNSKSVTQHDYEEIRSLLLGDEDEFVSNTSWRFVDRSYTFQDVNKPWKEAFPEFIGVEGLNTKAENVNFWAVKTGDINGSIRLNVSDVVENVIGTNKFSFHLENKQFESRKQVHY